MKTELSREELLTQSGLLPKMTVQKYLRCKGHKTLRTPNARQEVVDSHYSDEAFETLGMATEVHSVLLEHKELQDIKT